VYFVVGDFFTACIFAWLVNAAAIGFKGRTGKVLEYRPLLYLGKITYGIYIYHNLVPLVLVPIFDSFDIPLRVPSFSIFILSSLVTIVLAAISWHLIELPINRLKRHFEYVSESSTSRTTIKQLLGGHLRKSKRVFWFRSS
jgi:peptidoglycan/LPS O-acetylase OafA/YrhL